MEKLQKVDSVPTPRSPGDPPRVYPPDRRGDREPAWGVRAQGLDWEQLVRIDALRATCKH